MKTRREFLLGSAAVATLGATGAFVAPAVTTSVCAAVHDSLARLGRDTRFAFNNVLTAARDIYCPYCGESVVKHV